MCRVTTHLRIARCSLIAAAFLWAGCASGEVGDTRVRDGGPGLDGEVSEDGGSDGGGSNDGGDVDGGTDGGTPDAGPPPAGAEAVCGAIGAACVCSEPLNVFQDTPGSTFINPQDSVDKQCNGGASFYSAAGGPAVAEFGMPPGNAVNWVWSVDTDGTRIAHLTGNADTYANGTLCTRIYQRFSNDMIVDDSDDRIKLMEVSGPGHLHQMQWWFSGNNAINDLFSGYGFEANLDFAHGTGDPIALADCKGSWCRMEQCYDISGGTLVIRSRVVVLDSGKTFTMASTPVSASSITAETVWIGNLYTQNVSSGRRFVSHGMQAFWSGGNGEWIGPACEVEGLSQHTSCP